MNRRALRLPARSLSIIELPSPLPATRPRGVVQRAARVAASDLAPG